MVMGIDNLLGGIWSAGEISMVGEVVFPSFSSIVGLSSAISDSASTVLASDMADHILACLSGSGGDHDLLERL